MWLCLLCSGVAVATRQGWGQRGRGCSLESGLGLTARACPTAPATGVWGAAQASTAQLVSAEGTGLWPGWKARFRPEACSRPSEGRLLPLGWGEGPQHAGPVPQRDQQGTPGTVARARGEPPSSRLAALPTATRGKRAALSL